MEETRANGIDSLYMPLLCFTITFEKLCLINIIFINTTEKGKSRKKSLFHYFPAVLSLAFVVTLMSIAFSLVWDHEP